MSHSKSYKCKISGVVHDNVVHCKKKVLIHGKWKWQAPNYVRNPCVFLNAPKKLSVPLQSTRVVLGGSSQFISGHRMLTNPSNTSKYTF